MEPTESNMQAIGPNDSIFIGVGSNLGSSQQIMTAALQALEHTDQLKIMAASSLYRSAPMGPADQPDYWNAVVNIRCELTDPLALLDCLQQLEHQAGRIRGEQRWGPRTLDLDILLIGDKRFDLPRLRVPHYGLEERNFVVFPLLEIDPGLQLPGGHKLDDVARELTRQGIQKTNSGRRWWQSQEKK